MKKVIAVILSAAIVALLVTGSVLSGDQESGNAQVDISGNWTVEYQDTYLSEGPLGSGNYTMQLYQSGNDVSGSYVIPATPTTSEFKGAITGEVGDGDTIVLTSINVGDEYIGITKMRGDVSLNDTINDTISGTYLGSDNFGKVWEGIFRARRPLDVNNVNITEPKEGDEVACRHWVKGNSSATKDTGLSVHVLTWPIEAADWWWVQPTTTFSNGSWQSYAYFGECGDHIGTTYKVVAIITGEVLRGGDKFRELPDHVAESGEIIVTRI